MQVSLSAIVAAGTVARAKRAQPVSGKKKKGVMRGGKVLRKWSWKLREESVLCVGDRRTRCRVFHRGCHQ